VTLPSNRGSARGSCVRSSAETSIGLSNAIDASAPTLIKWNSFEFGRIVSTPFTGLSQWQIDPHGFV
jgi:hypothetical protein